MPGDRLNSSGNSALMLFLRPYVHQDAQHLSFRSSSDSSNVQRIAQERSDAMI